MKLDVRWGVFGKYVVVAYNRVAAAVVDFIGRAVVVAMALLAFWRSLVGFWGA